MSIRLGLALVVLALDTWALNRLYQQERPRRDRLKWTFAIVAFPIFGILFWRRDTKRRSRATPSRAEQVGQ